MLQTDRLSVVIRVHELLIVWALELSDQRKPPGLDSVHAYHDVLVAIDALVDAIERLVERGFEHNFRPDSAFRCWYSTQLQCTCFAVGLNKQLRIVAALGA